MEPPRYYVDECSRKSQASKVSSMTPRISYEEQKSASAYWWKGIPNFGDSVAPYLLEHFADIDAQWSPPGQAKIVSTGSVLEHLPAKWGGYIVGSGKLHEDSRLKIFSSKVVILALRGPLTAKGIPGDYALGDPGLLADELVTVATRKHALGIVPHWSDNELARNPLFLKYDPIIINARDNPLDVIRQIGECKKIVSSSLHGLIVADAFGIPRRFEYPKIFNRQGGAFKIRDYSQSIRVPFEVGKTVVAPCFHVEDRKHELYDAYRMLGSMI